MATTNVIALVLFTLHLTFIDAVTQNPNLCPTNKIAVRRKQEQKGRTFISFFPNDQNSGSLQEEPLPDDPNDCDDIADYDENDLSSVTPQRKGRQKFFFQHFFPGNQEGQNTIRPPQRPTRPPPQPVRPQQPIRPPQKPYPPARPPYASGGQFSNNQYHPQYHEYPSDSIKPVYEGVPEPQLPYRPSGVVGGPANFIVGVPRPPSRPQLQFGDIPQPVRPNRPRDSNDDQTKPQPRKFSDSILGSFFDLLL